jgi:hypothetical protein
VSDALEGAEQARQIFVNLKAKLALEETEELLAQAL